MADARRPSTPEARQYAAGLSAILFVGMALRIGYVIGQAASDPTFDRPILDGLVYVEWARALAAGTWSSEGAFYLAPLYPYLLAVLIRLLEPGFGLVYLLQHALLIAAAVPLAEIARSHAGARAGLVAAALFTLHQPLVFFASRPIGEPLALALMISAVWLAGRRTRAATASGGVLMGLATLCRPNLLLAPLAWIAAALWQRSGRRGLLVVAGLALALAPVTLRNLIASGHWVPVSSNSGITAYHGNGPGAVGIYTPQPFFSGSPLTQRAEATAVARQRAGTELDDVEADRYWGREALRTRLGDPWGSVKLFATRGLLLVDNFEHGLDYPPMLDPNPWRLSLRVPADAELFVVPFGLLFGLAVAGLVVCGIEGSGGRELWLTLGAAALTPLLFYVSSRYRLPVSALLPVPAAAGLVALTSARLASRARMLGWAVALVAALTSFLVPSAPLRTSERAAALSNLAFSYLNAGRLEPAERRARQALELAPRVASSRLALAKILEARGNVSEALETYRMTLFVDPGQSEAAGSAARLLIGQGRPAEAVPLLRGALAVRPGDARGWHLLVLAHVANGDPPAARAAFDEARRHGITLDPALLDAGTRTDTTTEEP